MKLGNFTGSAFSGGRTGAPLPSLAFVAVSSGVPLGFASPAASTEVAALGPSEGEGDVNGEDDGDGVVDGEVEVELEDWDGAV